MLILGRTPRFGCDIARTIVRKIWFLHYRFSDRMVNVVIFLFQWVNGIQQQHQLADGFMLFYHASQEMTHQSSINDCDIFVMISNLIDYPKMYTKVSQVTSKAFSLTIFEPINYRR